MARLDALVCNAAVYFPNAHKEAGHAVADGKMMPAPPAPPCLCDVREPSFRDSSQAPSFYIFSATCILDNSALPLLQGVAPDGQQMATS